MTPARWVQIFAPRGPATSPATGADVERAEFDVVEFNGGTRMYVGVGGGAGQTSRVFRSDSVRAGAPTFMELTNNTSAGYCDPQCNYDNYVYVPRKADGSAHSADTVYLLGDNDYTQAAQGTSNGRAVLLSTDAGASFTDMTYDAADDLQPHGIHPDQHSILTHPADWKRFLETGDGGIVRSNGNFFDDSAQCARYSPPLTPSRLATCQAVTSRIPERLESINKGLNTLHFYQVTFNPNRPGELAGGAQDNGSWMRLPGTKTWIETYVADGAFNGFDASDPNYSSLSWQFGALAALDQPRNQQAGFFIADTLATVGSTQFRYDREAVAFSAPTLFHPNVSKLMFTSREHVFRSLNGGVNPNFAYAEVKEHCNLWTGNHDINENGVYERPVDICDDWKPMGNPDHPGRLTYGPLAACPTAADPTGPLVVPCPAPYPWGEDRSGGHVSVNEPSPSDSNVVWAGDQRGTDLHHDECPARPTRRRSSGSGSTRARRPIRLGIRPTSTSTLGSEPRLHHLQRLQPRDAGHAGSHLRGPVQPRPTGTATFTSLDGTGSKALGDLPVGTIERDEKNGDLYIGTDFGVARQKGSEQRVAARPRRGSRRPRFRT